MVSMDNLDSPWSGAPPPDGLHRARCRIPNDLLNEGDLFVESFISTVPAASHELSMPEPFVLNIRDAGPGGVRGEWVGPWPDSVVRPRLRWEHDQLSSLMVEQAPGE